MAISIRSSKAYLKKAFRATGNGGVVTEDGNFLSGGGGAPRFYSLTELGFCRRSRLSFDRTHTAAQAVSRASRRGGRHARPDGSRRRSSDRLARSRQIRVRGISPTTSGRCTLLSEDRPRRLMRFAVFELAATSSTASAWWCRCSDRNSEMNQFPSRSTTSVPGPIARRWRVRQG